jgi:hypothetical protein
MCFCRFDLQNHVCDLQFIQSDVNIELMDVEKNSAVISLTPPDPQVSIPRLLVIFVFRVKTNSWPFIVVKPTLPEWK